MTTYSLILAALFLAQCPNGNCPRPQLIRMQQPLVQVAHQAPVLTYDRQQVIVHRPRRSLRGPHGPRR